MLSTRHSQGPKTKLETQSHCALPSSSSRAPELVANSQPSESGSIPKWQVCQDLFRVRYSKENWGTDR